MLSPGMNRFLSYVAFAAVIPLLGLGALLMKISVPSADGGMEPTMAMVVFIAMAIIFGALSVVAINFGIQLNRQAKGITTTP